jgi:hypothetical protein
MIHRTKAPNCQNCDFYFTDMTIEPAIINPISAGSMPKGAGT